MIACGEVRCVTSRYNRCNNCVRLAVCVCVVTLLVSLLRRSDDQSGVLSNCYPNRLLRRGIAQYDQGNCVEKRHIMFLKLEKTGGDTFAAILVRFGLRRNVSFAIPIGGQRNYEHFPRLPLSPEMIVPIWYRPNTKYEILFRHSIYNRTTVKTSFQNDTATMVIVRHPFLRFLSSFDYFNERYLRELPKSIQMSDDKRLQVTTFMDIFYQNFTSPSSQSKGNWHLNIASARFGVPMTHTHDKDFVQKYLDDVLPDFKMALLNEYYDESLVLLKRRLCWKTQDIVYISVHVKAGYTKDPGLHTPEVLHQHKELAPVEYLIYDRLSRQFWEQVHEEGAEFWSEVQEFKSVLRRFQTFCQQTDDGKAKRLKVLKTQWHEDITFELTDCMTLSMDLGQFTVKTRKSYLGG